MLKSSTQIEKQDWMITPEAVAVMNALNDAEDQPNALFVGGCVRNTLLGVPVADIDIATQWTPAQAKKRLKKAKIKVVPTGVEHGTITAVTNNTPYEITTLRSDIVTDGRHAKVRFTDDWSEDAGRRDFTMNALYADCEGNIYDPTGEGLRDLEAGLVRFVGDPDTRIAEDYLRILRFFRFYAYYGSGAPDSTALEACRAAAGKIETLSRERITQEFVKMLMHESPADVLNLMFENNILADIPCQNFQLDLLSGLTVIQKKQGCGRGTLESRLVILAHGDDRHLLAMEKWLVFSNAQKRMMATIINAGTALQEIDVTNFKIVIYRFGLDAARQALYLRLAEEGRQYIQSYLQEILDGWQVPEFPLNGEDVKSAGVKAGPEVGRILGEIESWWIGQGFQPGRDDCCAMLAEMTA